MDERQKGMRERMLAGELTIVARTVGEPVHA